MVRAREAREKQDRERAERAAKKKALVDFNAPDDQEGVMDSLLEALKTGSAFNRDQKRKRAPRAAGGNLSHCWKSSFFVQKFNFDFPRKIVEFFWGKKLVKMLWLWTF